jgi:hypothetical protein
MILRVKEVVHMLTFVFVHVEFGNVSGEPRLNRPTERGTRDSSE